MTEFKVGQKWKTRSGLVVTIIGINSSAVMYPINASFDDKNNLVREHRWPKTGRYFLDLDFDHQFDLVEMIKDNRDLGTKAINGFEVPLPMSKPPELCEKFYFPAFSNPELFGYGYWQDHVPDQTLFKLGLCFKDKSAAIATAKAMLGIDPNI